MPPINKFHVNSSICKHMDNALAITADNGTNKLTVTASIDFIAQALATQHKAVQTTPKKMTCKMSKILNEKANSSKTLASNINE